MRSKKKVMSSKFVLFSCALLLMSRISATNANDEEVYEPADDICEKCNCTNVNEILENGESGTLFTIDCSMKSFQHIFAKWPESMGDNHNAIELIYVMSFNGLNRLQQFPSTDAALFFTCRHCKITQLATSAFIDVPNVNTIDLSFNKISSSDLNPDIFRGPENDDEYSSIRLASLDLSHNIINYLDENLFEHIPHLKKLDVSYNQLKNLEEGGTAAAISKLYELEILNLGHTGIFEVPESIFESMQHLSELILRGNHLKAVPHSLSAVGKSLEHLHLDLNPIEEITKDSFRGLTKLEWLNISQNAVIEKINEGAFSETRALEVLICSYNKRLNTFYLREFLKLEHLKEFDISHNNLTTLNFGEIEDVDKILNSSKIERATYFQHLHTLRLEGNPWHCDCKIMRSLELFNKNATYFKRAMNSDEARCETPYDLLSKLLYDLQSQSIYHLSSNFYCSDQKTKPMKIPIYDPPQFLRPKSIVFTIVAVVAVVVVGIIIGFIIVCIKRKLKANEYSNNSNPIRYTAVRDSTVSNVVNMPYQQP